MVHILWMISQQLKAVCIMFKITSKHVLIGAALVGVYMIYKNSQIVSGVVKRVPSLYEMNPYGADSIFEQYGNGK